MTRFWQRRIALALLVFGLLILIGFAVETVTPILYPKTRAWAPLIDISLVAAIGAGIAVIIAVYSYFKTHPEDINENARICYLLFLALSGTLTVTAHTPMPYLFFWAVAVAFAPIFGGVITILSLIVGNGYILLSSVTGANYPLDQMIYLFTTVNAPLLLGLIVWHGIESTNPAAEQTKEDRAYSAIAKQLHQASGKSDVVIKTIGEGVLALDGKGVIELINPAAQQIVGWGDGDALSLNYKSVLKLVNSQNDELDPSQDPVQIALTTNTASASDSFSLVTQSGRNLLVSVVASPIGQPGMGAIVVFRDITKERAEERQQAEFISTASHEMRTPVASIEGYLGLALNPQTAQIDEKARDFITKAHESAQHLGRLFQDLLDVSKADDSRLKNDPKLVDVVRFSKDIVEGLRPKADEKKLALIFRPMLGEDSQVRDTLSGRTISPVFYANVDNDHLREIVANLVENAIKYTLEGQVTVDVQGDDSHVTISIADTGLGIPREEQAHLFQKFYRIDNTQTREIGGTGLGLYLCRRLAEAMNGRVYLESEYKKGSTFFLEIPRTSSLDASRIMQETESAAAHIENQVVEAQPTTLPSDDLVAAVANEPLPPVAPVTPTPQPAPILPQLVPVMPQPMPIITQQPTAPPVVVPQPVAQPMPMPMPQPMPQQPPVDTSVRFQNVPLSALEANKEHFAEQIQNRSLSIPPRDQP